MISALRYGTGSLLKVELPSARVLAVCPGSKKPGILDVGVAVDAALANPIDYPPLSQAVLPGDRVTLALADGVPQAATIVARIISALVASGVSSSDVTLLCAPTEDTRRLDLLNALPEDLRKQIHFSIHNPEERQSLNYLAATADAKPIYINHALHDADVVISIGCLRPVGSPGYFGVSSTVFPTFSDAKSLSRYRSLRAGRELRKVLLRKRAKETRWLLGAQLTVQVVPGACDEVAEVLAGDLDSVERAGRRAYEECWGYEVPARAALVVTTIEGDSSEQSWHNVARALWSASRVAADDGSVMLCTDLSEPPKAALQRMAGCDDLPLALEDIRRQRLDGALEAGELAKALARGKVYFVSGLDPELVEDLGMAPLEASQVPRLIERHESSILLANAHQAVVRAEGRP